MDAIRADALTGIFDGACGAPIGITAFPAEAGLAGGSAAAATLEAPGAYFFEKSDVLRRRPRRNR
jgi:hypothetical protein